MKVTFERDNFRVRKENELPSDWCKSNRDVFTKWGSNYFEAKKNTVDSLIYAVSDSLISDIITDRGFQSILDVGVGGGERLANIRNKTSLYLNLLGTETSGNGALARENGIKVSNHDMRNPPLPYEDNSLDMILFLSADFGYVMDKEAGPDLRLKVLNDAYDKLKKGGMLFLELASQSDSRYLGVWEMTRTLCFDGVEDNDSTGTTYLKTFGVDEIKSLLKKSKFKKTDLKFMPLVDPGEDLSRIGLIFDDYSEVKNSQFDIILTAEK